MGTSQITLVEEEFKRLGLWKIDEAVRQEAARLIAQNGSIDRRSGNNNGLVKDLVTLYQEIKMDEFLQDGFNRLPAQGKLNWLKEAIEKPEFQEVNYGMALSGRGGSVVPALIKAYKDKDQKLKKYAKGKLEKLVFTEKKEIINKETVGQIVDELCFLYELPQPYAIKEETLKDTATNLKSFLFNLGGNIYVLSYQKDGGIKHTLIDTGEKRYRPNILKLFKNNGVEPANIERILLTHHHFDHSGLLDVLCMASGAKVMVHPDFKSDSIELDISRFGKYLEWLPAAREDRVRNIGGITFPILGEPVDIGEGARLEILGLPGGDLVTHTVDQLLFFYTPKNSPETLRKIGAGFRLTDEILFSGDLWLIHPPGFFEDTIGNFLTHKIVQERRRNFDFRPQNRAEKDALKKGYSLITVKPGHGPEFLGTRIIGTLLANRDILVKLGFDENDDRNIINEKKFTLRMQELKEDTDRNFLDELKLWLRPLKQGGFEYKSDEVAELLLRIYREHTGGGELVGQDRRERRADLREKLAALKADKEQPEEMRLVAKDALEMIEKVP